MELASPTNLERIDMKNALNTYSFLSPTSIRPQ
jgi:hypothetical protein